MRGVVSLAAALAMPLTLSDGSPFPGRDLHFVHHLLRDSRDARAPRSEFARGDPPPWSGG